MDKRFACRPGMYKTSFILMVWPYMLETTFLIICVYSFSLLVIVIEVLMLCLLVKIDSYGVICWLVAKTIIQVMKKLSFVFQASQKLCESSSLFF